MTTPATTLATPAAATLRFAEKRELILDGAARLFNRRGIRAGTLAEVAASVGLATNSLTYYYRKKEDLVCACLLRSIAALATLIGDAAQAGPLPQRVQALVHGFITLMADVADRRHPALVFFGDMRALPSPLAGPVFAAYVEMWRGLRRLLRTQQGPADDDDRRALNARTHLLLAELLWSRAWLTRYETSDFQRLARVISDLLLHGLAAAGAAVPTSTWHMPPPTAPQPGPDATDELGDAYLRTATRVINDHGVGGASVERIAATLALTKGSFYHHHDTKHGLVQACFERSFALIRQVQLAALALPGSGWQQLLAATLPLVALHDPALDGAAGPLLRLTAWTELPDALRWQKYRSMGRLGERYAAIITDGMLDGSVRPVDAAVAAQLVCGLLNALGEAGHWISPGGQQPLTVLLAQPLLQGLLAPSPAV